MKKNIVIVLLVILILIICILIYWKLPYSPLKSTFKKDIKIRLDNTIENKDICTQEEINKLPKLLKEHCEYIGLVGTTKHNVVNAEFKNTKFVFDSNKNTIIDMDYSLWLFMDKPFRSALCASSMYGVPFDGLDYCTDNKEGGMKGVLGKSIQLFDVHNEQMYKAGLISLLAEGVAINPCVLLSDYITYREIDSTHIEATITYNDVVGKGIFTFDEKGRLMTFESDERQVEEIDGVMTPIGWRAVYKDYHKNGDFMVPNIVQSIKTYPDKEVIYFDAKNIDINYYK